MFHTYVLGVSTAWCTLLRSTLPTLCNFYKTSTNKSVRSCLPNYMYMHMHMYMMEFESPPRQFIFLGKISCLAIGCAVLLCFVVCMTLLASFFLPVHLSLTCTLYPSTPENDLSMGGVPGQCGVTHPPILSPSLSLSLPLFPVRDDTGSSGRGSLRVSVGP